MVVLYGSKFWKEVLNFDALVKHGTIRADDLKSVSIRRRSRRGFAYFPGKVVSIFPGARKAHAGSGSRNSPDREVACVTLESCDCRHQNGLETVREAGQSFPDSAADLHRSITVVPASAFVSFLQFVLFVLGAWLAIRLSRFALRKAIWRLRNRILVTYVLSRLFPFC